MQNGSFEQGRLNQANGRLKMSKVGVSILQRGDRLYLQAVLPPRPGSGKSIAYQQQLALGIHANVAGISLAEKEARKLGFLLDSREFDWGLYDRGTQKSETIADWIQKFEEEKRPTVSTTTWKTDYLRPLGKLPTSELLTVELLLGAIAQTKPNSQQRRRCCLTFRQLAKFAGLELDIGDLIGTYSAKKVLPRELPTDEEIADCFGRITNPQWQWAFGAIAAYGLRNHEVFFLDLSKFPIAQVIEGKTGYRQVWPLRPEWADCWNLAEINII